jgi:hypothetical protein
VKNELYNKLVDMYAGHELSAELEDEMEMAAASNPALNHDMTTLRRVVDTLKTLDEPDFTDESYHRILMRLYARAGDIQPQTPAPTHFQYHLPLQG